MSGLSRNIPIMMSRKTSVEEVGEKVVGMLDEIERRVENLRETASLMEMEKESLMEMLNTVQMNKEMLRLGHSDKEDIEVTTNRLLGRCRTVTVNVSTPRNIDQEKALRSINDQIDELVQRMRVDLDTSKQACQGFLNACSPDAPRGPIDQKFQSALIGCTADDQKKTRRQLEHLFTLIQRAEQTVEQGQQH